MRDAMWPSRDLIQIQVTPGEIVQRDGFYFMDLRLSERRCSSRHG